MRIYRSVLLPLICLGAACGGNKQAAKPTSGAPAVVQAPGNSKLASACSGDGRTSDSREIDVDGDGRPEVVKYYQQGEDPQRPGERRAMLVRQDIDLNWDGRLDVCRQFAVSGQVSAEELDLDYDGKIDDIRTYEDGVIVQSMRDRNNDGKPDVVRKYKGGKLVQKDVDTNDDGRADRWEYFDGDRLDRVGIDLDHDGKVDRWGKSTAQAAAAAAEPATKTE